MQFDRLFESKAESTAESKAESKAECGAYFTVVLNSLSFHELNEYAHDLMVKIFPLAE